MYQTKGRGQDDGEESGNQANLVHRYGCPLPSICHLSLPLAHPVFSLVHCCVRIHICCVSQFVTVTVNFLPVKFSNIVSLLSSVYSLTVVTDMILSLSSLSWTLQAYMIVSIDTGLRREAHHRRGESRTSYYLPSCFFSFKVIPHFCSRGSLTKSFLCKLDVDRVDIYIALAMSFEVCRYGSEDSDCILESILHSYLRLPRIVRLMF